MKGEIIAFLQFLHRTPLPEKTFENINKSDSVLFGGISDPDLPLGISEKDSINTLHFFFHYLAQIKDKECVSYDTYIIFSWVEVIELNRGTADIDQERSFGCSIRVH